MKLTQTLIVGCVALSALLLAVPAQAHDHHHKHKHHKKDHDKYCHDDRRGDYSNYGRSYDSNPYYYEPYRRPVIIYQQQYDPYRASYGQSRCYDHRYYR